MRAHRVVVAVVWGSITLLLHYDDCEPENPVFLKILNVET